MIERKSYYIYIIKFYFTLFPLCFCFADHVTTLTTLTTPLTKSLCFLWCHHGGRGHWMVGVFPVSVCVVRKMFPFWCQYPRADSVRWAFGTLAGFVPICRWRRTGKTSKCIQRVYKNYRNFGKVWFLCLCIQKCRTQKIAYSEILQ